MLRSNRLRVKLLQLIGRDIRSGLRLTNFFSFTQTCIDDKNPAFHGHLDVPANAAAGEYHVIFTVEDEEENTVEHEIHFEVTAS